MSARLAERSTAIIVLGMHRSGTSALTGVLSMAGANPGPSLMQGDKGTNPKGFWEHKDVVAIHERLLSALGSSWDDALPLPENWWLRPSIACFRDELIEVVQRDFSTSPLWILKDPRLCRLLPMWLEILQELDVQPYFIICLRHPFEVARSLEQRDGIQAARACLLWLEHFIESERWTRGHARTVVDYEQLLVDWCKTVQQVAVDLSISLPLDKTSEEQIDLFLEPSLRHHQGQNAFLGDHRIFQLASEAFQMAVSGTPDRLTDSLVAIAEETTQMTCYIGPWVAELQAIQSNNKVLESLSTQLVEANAANQFEVTRVKATFSWRITKPIRLVSYLWRNYRDVGSVLVSLAHYPNPLKLVRATVRVLRASGPTGFLQAIKNFAQGNLTYPQWVARNETLSEADRAAIDRHMQTLKIYPQISVLMPVFNTPEILLRRAIESVRQQIYPHWELCIADDASTELHVRSVLESYARMDERIHIVRRARNGHISAASNSCLELAHGEFVALFDHDDELAPHALYMVAATLNEKPWLDLIFSDEDKIDSRGQRFDPNFKPDWNPDLFMATNMVCHLAVYRTDTVRQTGGFREGYEGSQDWDLALRVSEVIPASHIHHIPHVLYHWRVAAGSTASSIDEKPYAVAAGLAAMRDHVVRMGLPATVSMATGTHLRVRYELPNPPPYVSIIVPTRNGLSLLRRCIESVQDKTDYGHYEILIVDNQSDAPDVLDYLASLKTAGVARVLCFNQPFNYSAINNFAVKSARGEMLCLMNNDIEIISRDWLDEMVAQASRPEIGAVGAMLYYPDDSIQHAGVTVGMGGVAGHSYVGAHRGTTGYMYRVSLAQNLSAVTGACLVVRKVVYEELGGMDERNLPVAFNDVDFCLRAMERGYRNLWTPFAELYHHESATRGLDNTPDKLRRFHGEMAYMRARWRPILENDPAYNPNLTLENSWPYFAKVSRARKPWRTS
jgi:glycosyltransferase involved in cell wall biosynthesis